MTKLVSGISLITLLAAVVLGCSKGFVASNPANGAANPSPTPSGDKPATHPFEVHK